MTQEDKQLLLKDLCARLPHRVIIEGLEHPEIMTIRHLAIISVMSAEPYKPYLRHLSSMTEEEKKELKTLFDAEEITSDSICYLEGGTLEEYLSHISYSFCSKIIDWLNEHHFDYCGLIPMGLALEAPKDMYK